MGSREGWKAAVALVDAGTIGPCWYCVAGKGVLQWLLPWIKGQAA